jgi:hypothetical protein
MIFIIYVYFILLKNGYSFLSTRSRCIEHNFGITSTGVPVPAPLLLTCHARSHWENDSNTTSQKHNENEMRPSRYGG